MDIEGEVTAEDGDAGGDMYTCELCGARCTSHQTLQCHLRGRWHVDMVQRSEVAKRSVYVRGFSDVPSAEGDLRQVMGQFGEVVSVVVKASSADTYALVEFSSTETALRALSHTSPLSLHNTALTVKPRLLTAGRLANKRWFRQGRKQRVDVAMVPATSASPVGVDKGTIGGIELTPEAVAAISTATTVNTQLEAMALHCRLSNRVSELQLVLAWKLQSKLRVHMPSCMVIPFGAPFSGHGTVSSDCDLCVLSEPDPTEVAVFSGPAYLPTHLHTHWKELQTSPPLSGANITQPQPRRSEEIFDVVLAMVQSDPCCSNVLPLRMARCPIVRFFYKPHQLHCDISFDNRLGPANTRLLAAYMNFDPRMSILVPCVRLWAKGQGLKRNQLNNYALSLMLIHSLQNTSPPVLPCLQEPGVWPRNMAWIGSRGFSAEQQLMFSGWNCSFTNPLSLLPSTNTASAAQLLLHFFQFYAEEFPFQDRIIAIHTLSPLSCHHPTPSPDQSAGFKVSSVCLQDPFDRSHNVTKNMMKPVLLRALQSSQLKLQELLGHDEAAPNTHHSILSLFKQVEPMPTTGKKPRHVLQFDIDAASQLFHETCYEPLAGRLQELDMSNKFVHNMLNCVILHALAGKLEEEFGFRVHSEEEQSTVVSSTGSVCPPPQPDVMLQCSGHMRKRQRPTEDEEEEVMEVEEGGEEVKRQRLEDQESAEQLLFRLSEGKGLGCQLVVSAMEESWIGRRRRRRREEQRQASLSPEAAVKPSITPCLSFVLSTLQNQQQLAAEYVTTLQLHLTDQQFHTPLQQFFAVCKKWLFSSSH